VLFFVFVTIGQLRIGEGTLEQRFHNYINGVSQQKFFVGLLGPVHGLLQLAGVPVDEKSIQEVKNAKDEPKSALVPLLVSPQKLESMKEAFKERQRVLKESEQNSP